MPSVWRAASAVSSRFFAFVLRMIDADSLDELDEMRAACRGDLREGLMLKRRAAPYGVGRKKGDWWKWKVDPLTIDAVMIYAQQGHGRRANLFTDFTFAVWQGNELVPFTKAYSGLTDSEFNSISRWVRNNTIERFGPVCSVKPEHVFELAFEGIDHQTERPLSPEDYDARRMIAAYYAQIELIDRLQLDMKMPMVFGDQIQVKADGKEAEEEKEKRGGLSRFFKRKGYVCFDGETIPSPTLSGNRMSLMV